MFGKPRLLYPINRGAFEKTVILVRFSLSPVRESILWHTLNTMSLDFSDEFRHVIGFSPPINVLTIIKKHFGKST